MKIKLDDNKIYQWNDYVKSAYGYLGIGIHQFIVYIIRENNKTNIRNILNPEEKCTTISCKNDIFSKSELEGEIDGI